MVEINNLIGTLPVPLKEDDLELLSAWTQVHGDTIVLAQRASKPLRYETKSGQEIVVELDEPVEYVVCKGGDYGRARKVSRDSIPDGQHDSVRKLVDLKVLYWKNSDQKERTLSEARQIVIRQLTESPDFDGSNVVEVHPACAGLKRSERRNYPMLLIHRLPEPVVGGIDAETDQNNSWNRVYDCVVAMYSYSEAGGFYVEALAREKRLVVISEEEIAAAKKISL